MNQSGPPNQNFPVPSRAADSLALQSERILLVSEANPTNNLRDYMSIFFKHKTGIVVAFLVLSVIGVAAAFAYHHWIYEPKFQAKSSIFVKFGWENFPPDLSLGNRQAPSVGQAEILGSEISILLSRDLKEKVVRSLKPENIFPMLASANYQGLSNNEAAVVLLEKGLVVTAGKRGNIIDVMFEGNDPGRAAAVVNQLVRYYIDKRSEIYKDPKSVLFLEKKADEYGLKLEESEGRLKAFRDETKIISFEEERSILLKQRSDLMVALNNTATYIKEVQEKVGELEKQLGSLPKTVTTATAYGITRDAEAKLLNLQLAEKELLSKYKEDNPLVANIRAQIAMIKEYLDKSSAGDRKSGAAPADPVYQDVQKQILVSKAELSALKVKYADTGKQLGELNTQIQTLEARENRNRELTREVSTSEERYRSYRQKLEEARLYDELDRQKMTSVSVIEPAAAPIVPVNPRPIGLLIAVAIGAAILGSLGIAYVRELGKQVMSTATEAEKRLDLPVLVTIPIKN